MISFEFYDVLSPKKGSPKIKYTALGQAVATQEYANGSCVLPLFSEEYKFDYLTKSQNILEPTLVTIVFFFIV